MVLLKSEIEKIVDNVSKRQEARSGFIPSAVMMLFYEKNGETHVATIRRTEGATLHSGNMAFPGGKIDPGDDSSRAAAVRETFEEVGVSPESYEYIGEMGFFETLTSQHDAAAHVAWAPQPPRFKKNDFEVAEIIEIPVQILYEQFRPDLNWDNQREVMYLNFQYQPNDSGEVVNLWGLTARVTHHFLQGLWQLAHHSD